MRVELLDYLDLPDEPRYDKIASVGMFEHVGVARFPKYFGKIQRCLKPGGFVLNHGITHNSLDVHALGSGIGDFVERYVFPGGELTHVSSVMAAMARAGLEVVDAEALREHYARTLWHWTERLEAQRRRGAARSRRRALPRLAHLHGGLGARVRARLAVAVAAAGRQAARRWPAAAPADAGVHVRRRERHLTPRG